MPLVFSHLPIARSVAPCFSATGTGYISAVSRKFPISQARSTAQRLLAGILAAPRHGAQAARADHEVDAEFAVLHRHGGNFSPAVSAVEESVVATAIDTSAIMVGGVCRVWVADLKSQERKKTLTWEMTLYVLSVGVSVSLPACISRI